MSVHLIVWLQPGGHTRQAPQEDPQGSQEEQAKVDHRVGGGGRKGEA